MKMPKELKSGTHFRCPKCRHIGHVYCYVVQGHVHCHCHRCTEKWVIDHGDYAIKTNKDKFHPFTCLFHGGWLEEEVSLVTRTLFLNKPSNISEDWRTWYKGRCIFTTWDRIKREVLIDQKLENLLNKVLNLWTLQKPRL